MGIVILCEKNVQLDKREQNCGRIGDMSILYICSNLKFEVEGQTLVLEQIIEDDIDRLWLNYEQTCYLLNHLPEIKLQLEANQKEANRRRITEIERTIADARAEVEKLRIEAGERPAHLPTCGTAYRGCAPDCPAAAWDDKREGK